MNSTTANILGGLLRVGIAAGGGYLIKQGWTGDQVQAAAGVFGLLLTGLWSARTHVVNGAANAQAA